ncbi:hypothetical protein BP5796_00301 [Coleophoma crateriformis]|uniref:Uncharacterized protein n=1 Tax=Coleophoma crateriformis TaxID=565419 RepID=A0A3D8T951_9HELO|nr:hypothetical protein BP5796_00301 [Coleophoma crateriformis]
MPIRNPFSKKPNNGLENDENAPISNSTRPTFEKVDTIGSKSSSAMSIRSSQSQEPAEYKMSVVNDSGVFIPPSPPERKSFWPRRSNPSNTSLNTTNSLAEIEPFPISRESFDSYRRSFDISARSPVVQSKVQHGRQSLDSRMPRLPRSAMNERRFERQPPTAEEGFEDVGLNDETKHQPKKKGFFSKFGDGSDERAPSPTSSRFHIGGRKRGQSGVGEELGSMSRASVDAPTASTEVKQDIA